MHHVAVGENQPVRSEHESRAAALAFARFAGTASRRLRNIDLHYRRADLFGSVHYRPGIGIEQGGVAGNVPPGGLDDRFGIVR
jgi:hypothetical protein